MDRTPNFLDKIGSLIPGYAGYAERDGRRTCDKHLRDILSSQIHVSEKEIIKRINKAISKSDKDLMRELETCRKKMNTIQSKIQFAPYGESSFFSDLQIREPELKKIYQFDLDIGELVNDIFSKSNESDSNYLLNKVEELELILYHRNNFIKEHK